MDTDDQIDWLSQWEQHAPHFKNGYIHLNLKDYGGEGKEIKLKPGGGFGDLSHPTTELTLRLMLPLVKDTCLVDVGCGSGILSLAGASAGAKKILAVDIEDEAVRHTKENAKLNRLQIHVVLSKDFPKDDLPSPLLIVMNMIRSEQKEAWDSLPSLHNLPGTMITSGILSDDSMQAEKQYLSWGWSVVRVVEMDGWLAYLLKK